MKNWIISVQGFVLNCVTYGFTSIMKLLWPEHSTGSFLWDICRKADESARRSCLPESFFIRQIYKMELAEYTILDFLMNRLVSSVLYCNTDSEGFTGQPYGILLFLIIIRDRLQAAVTGKKQDREIISPPASVTDYVCGMTDSYAKRLYQEMNGII